MVTVRLAAPSEKNAILDALASSFAEDPMMNWLVPHDSNFLTRVKRFFDFFWEANDIRLITDDFKGVLLATSPNKLQPSTLEMAKMLPLILRVTGIRNFRKSLCLAIASEKSKPKKGYYYLGAIAVAPHDRGRGHALALVRRMLEQCDAEKVPAYLEAASDQHVAVYQRFGFTPLEKIKVASNGPALTPMIRNQG